MENGALKERAEAVLKEAFDMTAHRGKLVELNQEIDASIMRLAQPMRVAVVGRIKAGKSTVVNALMGKEIAPVDSTEATYNISWIRYGAVESYTIHFRDNSAPEERHSLKDLEELVLRSEDKNRESLLKNIKYVEVSYPVPILKTFNIIDTPGLNSEFGYDSQNTKDFLRESKPDAIMYLFHKNPGEKDVREIIEHFQSGALAQANPINAIGVLTKIDGYWPAANPIEQGREVIRLLPGEIERALYTIFPLCGAVAFGALTLTEDEIEALAALSTMPPAILEYLLSDATVFSRQEQLKSGPIPVTTRIREMLFRKFGFYGVWLACKLIREQGTITRSELAEQLLQNSGFLELKQTLLSHFGNRSLLIKVYSSIQRIKKICFEKMQTLTGEDRQIVSKIYDSITQVEDQEHSFREFHILRDCYVGELKLSPEEMRDVKEVTGEFGISCAERLGLPARSTIEEMFVAVDEKLSRWRRKESSFLTYDYRTKQAARIISESYNRIRYHVEEARKHLYFLSE